MASVDPIERRTPSEAIKELLGGMNRGQHMVLVEALRRAGGEIRIFPDEFARAAMVRPPKVQVDGTDGPVIVRPGE
jgi:hypothetical protein